MAFYLTNPFLFAFVLLSVSFISIPTFADPNGSLIGDICPQTTNPLLCLKTLKSDPRSAQADLHNLGQISIELAQSNANETIKMIDLLNNNVTDPTLRRQFEGCSGFCSSGYHVIIDFLNHAKKFLKSGDYSRVTLYASGATMIVNNCDDCFIAPQALAPPQKLKESGQDFRDLSSIIQIIGKTLSGL